MTVFFFKSTSTTEIYTLSLHDALPISTAESAAFATLPPVPHTADTPAFGDRKSTRLNSSHVAISYAVFCLKKKTPPHAHGNPRTQQPCPPLLTPPAPPFLSLRSPPSPE